MRMALPSFLPLRLLIFGEVKGQGDGQSEIKVTQVWS